MEDKDKRENGINLINDRIEEIETPLTQHGKYLDKLVSKLAKGKEMEKILRTNGGADNFKYNSPVQKDKSVTKIITGFLAHIDHMHLFHS